jgi:Asp-tRNA(Asn)/Glu-tRNA(Gln) amidotransferase A subunit family amidase
MTNSRYAAGSCLLLALVVIPSFSGCMILPRPGQRLPGDRAFIEYWPPGEKSDSNQLRLAVKDNIDMKGTVTTAGSALFSRTHKPAEQDAPCLAGARRSNVRIVGKTNLTEFAVAPSGFNEFFGTPKNPFNKWRKLIPGGSSCGSAVAVARGEADVAFGTDTAGSIRVPAACCGIVGLKTTHGLISVKGVHPIEPDHLDTVGPMGKDVENTAKGMDLLQPGFMSRYEAVKAAKPSAGRIRVGRLKLEGTDAKIDQAVDAALARAGFQVVPLGEDLAKKWDEAKADGNTIAAAGAWISDREYRFAPGVAARTKTAILAGQLAYNTKYRDAVARQDEWQRTLRNVFQKVDVIALPTMQVPTPAIPPNFKIGILEARMLNIQNTVAVNFAGNPAVAVPIPLQDERVPTSLQFIGPRLGEAQVLNAARLVEASQKN